MKNKSIIALAVAALVSVLSLTGCSMFGPTSEIEIKNGYTSINQPSINNINVTGEDGTHDISDYVPEFTSGIFTYSYLPAGYDASTYVYLREAKKYTVTVDYADHGSKGHDTGKASVEIEVVTVGDNISIVFAADADGNPSLSVQ